MSVPPSEDELRILQQWEMLIVDPRQDGITAALISSSQVSKFIVGRIDVKSVTSAQRKSQPIEKLKAISTAIIGLMGPCQSPTPYNGILLANWDEAIRDEIFAEFTKFLNCLNLNVYLEVCGPNFITNPCFPVSHLAGMMFINGSIMSNGERRDYANFLPMKTALELATNQTFNHDFAVLMCEILDDTCLLTSSVLVRSFNWCGYFGAILWIGRRHALSDASENLPVHPPDSAFRWLKTDKVVAIHDNGGSITRFKSI